ncbi:MAG: alpha/beta fold hydrolase [Pseudochelatococcus sp.]|jgi:pimeloyl-ACP methyl ester carboxylesterase|uniref:alpha/beta fold hydrolase n=1 Tax=Pseudochelatococcus sp. TaxID=2020869 RepID=UPI003D9033E3
MTTNETSRDDQAFRDVYVSAKDGLKLHVREYGPQVTQTPAVVCLPGMARTAADFHPLATLLANDPQQPHRVICIDYRGRGLSEWDPDWTHYNPFTELDDLQQVLAALGVPKAVFVGTSRGGLIVLGLVAVAPELIHAVVFNDVGPVVEPQGLVRIRGYLGKLPQPADYGEAIAILRSYSDAQFPSLDDSHWEALAHGTWHEVDGKLQLAYDPALKNTLEGIDLTKAAPPLWPMFDGLKELPVLVVRGEKSDILRPDTLAEMQARHGKLETVLVADQGHTPVMSHADVSLPIVSFINRVSLPGGV